METVVDVSLPTAWTKLTDKQLRLVYYYDDGREFDVSQELQIEYYD